MAKKPDAVDIDCLCQGWESYPLQLPDHDAVEVDLEGYYAQLCDDIPRLVSNSSDIDILNFYSTPGPHTVLLRVLEDD